MNLTKQHLELPLLHRNGRTGVTAPHMASPRVLARVAVLLAAGLMLAACSSSPSLNQSVARKDVNRLYSSVLSTSSHQPLSQKVADIQDGKELSPLLGHLLSSEASAGVATQVHAVTFPSSSTCKKTVGATPCAKVVYTVLLGGKPVLKDFTGYAVQVDNHWLLAKASLCNLLTLYNGGSAPKGC
ncbi:MAG: hypothetical protein M1115_08960 [Actinobacteria bacterium]|nr:hypothetical protein [Actinomycetota bacterium]